MKELFILSLMAVAIFCVQGQGIPVAKCPSGEHSVMYCPRKAEPSCDNPTVHDLPKGSPAACGVPDCFCNVPKVRDTKTKKCVTLSHCS